MSLPKPPPPHIQKAIIVSKGDTYEINSHFKEGWKFVSSCPMPSGNVTERPTCLVIVDKVNKVKVTDEKE